MSLSQSTIAAKLDPVAVTGKGGNKVEVFSLQTIKIFAAGIEQTDFTYTVPAGKKVSITLDFTGSTENT